MINLPKYIYKAETRGKYRVKFSKEILQVVRGATNGTYNSKQAATDYADEVKSAYATWKRGEVTAVGISDRSVAGLIVQYKQTRKYSQLAASSKLNYSAYFAIALPLCVSGSNVAFGDMLISNVTTAHAEKLQKLVEDEISYPTSFQVISKLGVAWNTARKKLGIARHNPFSEMGLSKPPPRRQKWSDQQIIDMIKECDDQGYPSIGTHIVLCMHLAQRTGDMRTLTWDDLDELGLLNFTQQKTGIPMSMPITQLIEARLNMHTPAPHTNIILRNENTDQPYTADLLRKRFRKIARKCGFPDGIKVMDLRRTAATAAADAGATEAEIMAMTGHTRPETLREIYQLRTVTQLNNLNVKRGIV